MIIFNELALDHIQWVAHRTCAGHGAAIGTERAREMRALVVIPWLPRLFHAITSSNTRNLEKNVKIRFLVSHSNELLLDF